MHFGRYDAFDAFWRSFWCIFDACITKSREMMHASNLPCLMLWSTASSWHWARTTLEWSATEIAQAGARSHTGCQTEWRWARWRKRWAQGKSQIAEVGRSRGACGGMTGGALSINGKRQMSSRVVSKLSWRADNLIDNIDHAPQPESLRTFNNIISSDMHICHSNSMWLVC